MPFRGRMRILFHNNCIPMLYGQYMLSMFWHSLQRHVRDKLRVAVLTTFGRHLVFFTFQKKMYENNWLLDSCDSWFAGNLFFYLVVFPGANTHTHSLFANLRRRGPGSICKLPRTAHQCFESKSSCSLLATDRDAHGVSCGIVSGRVVCKLLSQRAPRMRYPQVLGQDSRVWLTQKTVWQQPQPMWILAAVVVVAGICYSIYVCNSFQS